MLFRSAFTDVLANTSRTAEWGIASRRRVEDHFTWEAIAERTLEVYRGALA